MSDNKELTRSQLLARARRLRKNAKAYYEAKETMAKALKEVGYGYIAEDNLEKAIMMARESFHLRIGAMLVDEGQ